eukprot:gnl/MRDRNA2_/MRDRNA2_58253_c0_seq1.p1 gnl/MRDRNA2_/MRDRNA2_58253_c0~~gnl/MRDRNA2_/MRDRNA2_58253_c0_seq1.p1  ORF type:complete len:220 (+),score=17.28 gnl/MRDRNA2_/MRDRNA2_58253_c0_seq1:100-759(+)
MSWYDVLIAGLGITATVAIIVLVFVPVIGVGIPLFVWFPWHTVLMTTGFLLFMSLGRRIYVVELPEGMDRSKRRRRILHSCLMTAASICICIGYIGIYMPHLPKMRFFGYDFKKHEWAPFANILHVYLGYAAISLVLFQCSVGPLKMMALSGGVQKYKFHGLIGHITHHVGIAAVLSALYMMKGWSVPLRLVVACCAIGIPLATCAAPSTPNAVNKNNP